MPNSFVLIQLKTSKFKFYDSGSSKGSQQCNWIYLWEWDAPYQRWFEHLRNIFVFACMELKKYLLFSHSDLEAASSL